MACKPVLDGPAELLVGYEVFHDQEGKYTAVALEEMPAAVATWYRYLTLYDRALRREHDSPSLTLDDQHRAWDLRLRLATTAAGTSKLTLDSALAGYYSQAYALLRYMLETWQQMVYVRVNPAAAQQWYSPDGVRPPQEPDQATIANRLRKDGRRDQELANNAAVVARLIVKLHKGAHPSGLAAAQPNTSKQGFLQLGAKFDRPFLASVLSKGTVAMALLLHEFARTIPVDEGWREEFAALGEARSRWHEAEPA